MREHLSASLLLLAAGMTGASADEPSHNPSTWRWTTTKAIDAQRGPGESIRAARDEFTQRYERYSYDGRIEAPR